MRAVALDRTRPALGLRRALRPRPRWGLQVVLIVYCALVIIPFLIVISASLHPAGLPGLLPENPTLRHYQKLMRDPKLFQALVNSVIVGAGSVVLSVLISATAGYAFSRYRFPGRGLLMGLVLGIFMIPVMVNIIPLFVMLQRLGWLNSYPGLIVPYQALILPLNVWLLKNFFDTIPRDLEEQAMVDGASRIGAFWRVTLPLTWPGVAVASIFAFRFAWNDFVFASTFTSTPARKTWQAAMYTFLGLERTDWGALTAGVVIGLVPVVFLFVLLQRRFIEGLTVGAVK